MSEFRHADFLRRFTRVRARGPPMTADRTGLAAGALVEDRSIDLSAPGFGITRFFVGPRIRHITVAPVESDELLTRDELAALLHDTAVIALHGFLIRMRFWLLPLESPTAIGAHFGCWLLRHVAQ